jgi:AcrR family transcriptional regulator
MRYRAGIETRDRILDAVRGLIAEKGLEGTTIKAICHRASVLPGSFAAAIEREHPELASEEAQRRAESLVVSLNGLALHRALDPDFDVAVHARRLMETIRVPA